MKKILAALTTVCMIALSAGCAHSQQPPSASVYQCPTPIFALNTVGNYTPLNPSTSSTNPPVSGTTYKDTTPGVNRFCYVAQSWDGQQISPPSNVSMVTVASGQSVTLTWIAPTSCGAVSVSACTYVLSRTPAVLLPPPTAPSLQTPTAAQLEKPHATDLAGGKDRSPLRLTTQAGY